jgi:DNA repair photolyase
MMAPMVFLSDLQRGGAAAPTPPTLSLDVQRVRTFDTPEFAGMTFHEVETRSALNRVRGMPFSWSINPYRGCSHACSYCLVGDTAILMGDGRTRPLGDLRPGDVVYGTALQGQDRRLVRTEVRDHWQTRKAAVRTVLADGTELVSSAEHRFLTPAGWTHVLGTEQGACERPHLSRDDQLVGIGRSDAPPAAGGLRQLAVASVEPLGVELPMFDITTGTGDFIANGIVSHNCFARPTHRYLNLSPLGDFERQVVVKTNVADVLRRELAKPSWAGDHVAMGTNTDPYQRCEGRYRLMPGIIEALAEGRTPFSILTKGTLIMRDLDVLRAAGERVPVGAALTVGMLDEQLWRTSEPGTPSPAARLRAVRALNDAGIPTGVMLAPIMPGLNDDPEQLTALVEAAAEAGAVHISPIVLHLRPGVREVFWPWLEQEHPHLVRRYAALYRRGDAAAPYREAVTAFVAQRRRAAWRRVGTPPVPAGWRGRDDDRRAPVAQDPSEPSAGGPASTRPEQLRLL